MLLANAAHIKNVSGRKTDVKDADWISDLLAHGLIRPSFVPDGPTQEMRTLLRTRKQLSREKASHILRIQKTLEDANIKLDSAQFHRIRARRGPKKAIVAVAASILTAIYHMLKDGTMYQDLGPNHFDRRDHERQKRRLVQRLADLGYDVELVALVSP